MKTLRALEPSDADFMYEVDNDSDAWRYSDTLAPLSRRQLRDYALNYDADPFAAGQLRLIVTDDGGSPVGILDLYEISAVHRRAALGIYILPDRRQQGLALKAVNEAVEYARNVLRLRKLYAKIEDGNIPSLRLFDSAGFTLEATLTDYLSTPSGLSNLHLLSLSLG